MDPILGSIIMFAGNYVPMYYAACDGQTLPISGNEALFTLIGTTYGGDGKTNFKLPDLRGRAPVHVNSTIAQGAAIGTEQVQLIVAQLPAHNHLAACTKAGNTTLPTNAVHANRDGVDPEYIAPTPSSLNTKMSAQFIESVGGNQPHDNMQPYLAINFIIAIRGTFPQQSY